MQTIFMKKLIMFKIVFKSQITYYQNFEALRIEQ